MSNRSHGGFFTQVGIVGELFAFVWQRKLWWLIPMILVIVVFAILLVFSQATPLAPFIYTLF